MGETGDAMIYILPYDISAECEFITEENSKSITISEDAKSFQEILDDIMEEYKEAWEALAEL